MRKMMRMKKAEAKAQSIPDVIVESGANKENEGDTLNSEGGGVALIAVQKTVSETVTHENLISP